MHCTSCNHDYDLDNERDRLHVFPLLALYNHVWTTCPACQAQGGMFLDTAGLDAVQRRYKLPVSFWEQPSPDTYEAFHSTTVDESKLPCPPREWERSLSDDLRHYSAKCTGECRT